MKGNQTAKLEKKGRRDKTCGKKGESAARALGTKKSWIPSPVLFPKQTTEGNAANCTEATACVRFFLVVE
jgi:hypothetical protein